MKKKFINENKNKIELCDKFKKLLLPENMQNMLKNYDTVSLDYY